MLGSVHLMRNNVSTDAKSFLINVLSNGTRVLVEALTIGIFKCYDIFNMLVSQSSHTLTFDVLITNDGLSVVVFWIVFLEKRS